MSVCLSFLPMFILQTINILWILAYLLQTLIPTPSCAWRSTVHDATYYKCNELCILRCSWIIQYVKYTSLLRWVWGFAVFLSITMEAGVLQPYKLSIPAVPLQQIVMAALLQHLSPLQEHHVVGHLHAAHLIGNEQHGATVWLLQQRLVHLPAKQFTLYLVWWIKDERLLWLTNFQQWEMS